MVILMNHRNDPLDPQLSEELAPLKKVPERNPQAAARGRAQFLEQAASLAPKAATPGVKQTRRGKSFGFMALFGKSPAALAVRLVLIIAIAAGLLGAGGAAAVYAARDSLPGDSLYPVKIWGEDLQLAFARSPESVLDLNLAFAERRITEISAIMDEDEGLAAQAMLRLQHHTQNAIQTSAEISGGQAETAMQRLRQNLERQQQFMQQLQMKASQAEQPMLEQSSELLQQQIREMENQMRQEQDQLQQPQNQGGQQPLPTSQPGMQGEGNRQNQGQQTGGQQHNGQDTGQNDSQMQQTQPPEILAFTPTPTPTFFMQGSGKLPGTPKATPMPNEKQDSSKKP